ncbi:iron-siderophore ABC transporter substrate-binding protein [Kitasatospora sp. NPDC094015]|uniref:iron-siderophore ABC transporter substrate-binding protein n=1 Tax=Kitasatospora sp. NPDC094015 TaxID=3155205 RepID=UPI003320B9F0
MPHQLPRRAVLAGLGAALLTGCAVPGTGRPHLLPPATGTGSPSPQPTPSTTVTAATGPVVVPMRPVRVVALDTAELDSAMTLGITPVGAAKAPLDAGLPDYWPASRLAQVAPVGDVGAADPARIAALKPQLILGNQPRDGARLDALTRIAPTVLGQGPGAPWKDNFQLHAAALDRHEQAAAVVGAYGRHVAQAVQAIGAAGSGGRRISVVRFVEGATGIRTYGRQTFIGSVLTDLQLGRPDAQNVDRGEIEVTPDQLAQVDGDFLFHATYGDPERSGAAAVLASPAWQALGAVKAHRAFPVEDQLWFAGIGYTGANLVIADLQRALGG